MADRLYVFPYCKRNDFKNARGLTQHQNQNQSCKFKATAKFCEDSAGKIAHSRLWHMLLVCSPTQQQQQACRHSPPPPASQQEVAIPGESCN